MRKLLWAALLFLLTPGLWAQSAPPATDDAAQLRQEIDQLKKNRMRHDCPAERELFLC